MKKTNKIDARETNAEKFFTKKNLRKKFYKVEEKANKAMMKPWFFVILVAFIAGGVVIGTSLYVKHRIGAFNEIFVVAMLDDGLNNGQWTAAIAFAVGYLIARILEAPLVGILDIGGSILTGVGIGIPAAFLSGGTALSSIIENPLYGMLLGLGIGAMIATIILSVRFFAKKGLKMDLGTDVMMGAGNQTGAFLSPLVIVAAAMVNPLTGIGAAIGSAVFFMFNKPVLGGAIIGSMLLGLIPAFL